MLAWVAGEQWKLDAYARYDATQDGHDEPYCILACRMLHVPDGSFTPESPERKIGKTADLACGYMGGAGAIEKFAPGVFDEAKREQIKTEWRAAHPNVVNFWYEIDRAAWAAVQNRSSVIRCGPVAFRCVGAFLFLKLPSGRKLAYPISRSKLTDPQHGVVLFTDNSAGRWRDCRDGRGAYPGTWVENLVQAISRDLLADAMLRIEAAGYSIVLTIHDEIIAEVPEGFGSTEEFARIVTRAPSWALTLPIVSESVDRYEIRLKEEHTSTFSADNRTATATATQKENPMLLASDYDKSKYLKASDLDHGRRGPVATKGGGEPESSWR